MDNFAEVLREVRKNAKPEDAVVDVKSIRRTRTGDILVELMSKINKKSTFCETMQRILGMKAVVFNW